LNYTNVKQLLSTPQKVVVTAHKSPDGDAIGSSMALAIALKKLGHEVNVLVPDQYPKFLDWMDKGASILIDELSPNESTRIVSEASIIFSLDYNNLSRVGKLGPKIERSDAVKILIDHHLFPDESFDFALSDTAASSTAELVFRFLNELGYKDLIDKSISESLYAGIMTDTGSFRFSSTSSETHRIVAELMDKGLIPHVIHERINDTNSFSRLKLIGHALSNKLSVHKSGKAAILTLSLKEKNQFGYQKGDSEGLVNYGLSIEGVEIAIFLSEELEMVKFSLRSKGNIDVNDIARSHFNGGGHRNAAGGKLDLGLEQALERLNIVINGLFE
jgi:phosphoesterase RecJ-like protein